MNTKKPELGKRLLPFQARAHKTYDKILKTAAVLLDEVGIDGFNTNLLAERAGIRVRTIYRYFPNKYSVIAALTENFSHKWDQWMTPFYDVIGNRKGDWRLAMRKAINDWMEHARHEPGSVTVLQAINAAPELRELHQEIFDNMCNRMAHAIARRGVKLSSVKLVSVSRAVVSTLNTGGDLYFQLNERESSSYLKELGKMLLAYLSEYMDD